MNCPYYVALVVSWSVFAALPGAIAAENSKKDDPQEKSERADKSDGSGSRDGITSSVLETQVLLDRVLFSPGAIDRLAGRSYELALQAFQKANDLDASGKIDEKTRAALRNAAQASDFVQSYTISEKDASVKFLESIPEDAAEMAKLDALSYTSLSELLAERFHTNSDTLAYLNPDAEWKSGEVVVVPNVFPTMIRTGESKGNDEKRKNDDAEKSSKSKDKETDSESDDKKSSLSADRLDSGLAEKVDGPVTVIVSKQDTSLNVLDENGKVIFHAPVSAGSEHDPLPIGDWTVNGTERYPTFNYNPELFWDAKDSDKKVKIPAGPNNSVGVAWIDISKPHYGLHGTPNPEKIGYTESHGCVRLTNWDVLRLADMVKPETKVRFLEKME